MSFELTLEKINLLKEEAETILENIHFILKKIEKPEAEMKFQKTKLRRLRSATSKFGKIAKDYRKVSIEYEKTLNEEKETSAE